MDKGIKFFIYRLDKNILINDYRDTDTILSYKNIFNDNNIDLDKVIFMNNFKEIKKTTLLSDIDNDNNIIISKNERIKNVVNNNKDIKNSDIKNGDINTYKYYHLLKKYPDLILFVYMINKNNFDSILYFLEKYKNKHKIIYNIIKNNQSELIEMISSNPDIIAKFIKDAGNIFSSLRFNFDFVSIINYFSNNFTNNTISIQIEDLFPDVPQENITELINIFTNNVLII